MANWFSRLFFGPTGGGLPLASATLPALTSPWSGESSVAALVYSDLYGLDLDTVDRAAAMAVAPVKRGRAIIVGSIADLPLEAGEFNDGEWVPATKQPAWLNSSTTAQTPWHRMAWTVDDLIFHGWSLWALNRSGDIPSAARIPRADWTFDQASPTGLSYKGAHITDPSTVILFEGPDEGLLVTGRDVIRGARSIEKAWVGRVKNPIPAMVLHEVEANGVTQAEAENAVAVWSAARTKENGAVGFLPASLNMEVYGTTDADLFTEGRNNVRLDVANLLDLPASLQDLVEKHFKKNPEF